MDQTKIAAREKATAKENALSVIKKLLVGTCLILLVGFLFYLLLFVLMLCI